MKIPRASEVMTPTPIVVESTEDTQSASSLMHQYGVRHLPVMQRGKLYGILSERDVRASLAFLEHAPGEVGPPVLAVCTPRPLVVEPDEPIDEVANKMADLRVGSALVVQGERLVGIVTTVDVCRELAVLVGRLRASTEI